MDLFLIVGWLIYGIFVGLLVKLIYKPQTVPSGIFSTLSVGVAGSFLGGFIRYIITGYGNPFQASGVMMGVLGGILACYIYNRFKNNG